MNDDSFVKIDCKDPNSYKWRIVGLLAAGTSIGVIG
jgi:hypothetical protein